MGGRRQALVAERPVAGRAQRAAGREEEHQAGDGLVVGRAQLAAGRVHLPAAFQAVADSLAAVHASLVAGHCNLVAANPVEVCSPARPVAV